MDFVPQPTESRRAIAQLCRAGCEHACSRPPLNAASAQVRLARAFQRKCPLSSRCKSKSTCSKLAMKGNMIAPTERQDDFAVLQTCQKVCACCFLYVPSLLCYARRSSFHAFPRYETRIASHPLNMSRRVSSSLLLTLESPQARTWSFCPPHLQVPGLQDMQGDFVCCWGLLGKGCCEAFR